MTLFDTNGIEIDWKTMYTKYNFAKGRNSKILFIVVHDTGNTTDSPEANARYFSQPNRKASAHYFVGPAGIVQIVEDKNTAYHVGDGKGKYGITNSNSIGIEMCRNSNYVLKETLDNTRALIIHLMKLWNIPIERVVRHYDASRKMCPNVLSSDNWAQWWSFKQSIIDDLAGKTKVKQGVVTASALNVRAVPTTKNNVPLAKLKSGQWVTIVRVEGDWAYIKSSEGIEGYVALAYIKVK